MPYKDPVLAKACKKRWQDAHREEKNAAARAQYKYRDTEKYKETKRAWYERTKEQRSAYRKAYRKANRDKMIAERIKGKCKKYGITEEQYLELLRKADHKCPVCYSKFKEPSAAAIDHCHKTGVVRGLLCPDCNFAEGHLKHPDNALRLYKYMLSNDLFYQKTN